MSTVTGGSVSPTEAVRIAELEAEGPRSERRSAPATARAPLTSVRPWPIALLVATTAWSILVLAIVREHYVSLRFARFDLGNMVQAVWSTTQGRPLEMTDAVGDQVSRLAAHVDPILVLLAPLWLVAPSPLTLAAVQVVAVAAGALPVFWLARRSTGSETAAGMLALAYLVYPWVAWTAVDAFHPVTLAIPLLLFAVWFLETDRFWLCALCAALALATGELMGIVVAALGIWYALARGRRAAGAAIAVAGMAWTSVALFVVVPSFADGPSRFYGFYDHVGGSPAGVLETALTDPGVLVGAATRGSDLLYVFLLAAPLGALFLLAPGLAFVALPQLAANLLADLASTTDPHAHYVAGVIPFLFAAIALGLGRLSPRGRVRATTLVLTLSAVSSAMVGPWPGALAGPPTFFEPAPHERVDALREAVSMIPDGAPVTATNHLGSRLAARRYAYSVPTLARAEWAVVDVSDAWVPSATGGGARDPASVRAFLDDIGSDSRWVEVFGRQGVFVFRRAGP